MCKYVTLIFVFCLFVYFFAILWLPDKFNPPTPSNRTFFPTFVVAVDVVCVCVCLFVWLAGWLSVCVCRRQHIKFLHLSKKVLLTPPDEGPRVKGQRIKLQDIVDGLFVPQHSNGSWIDGECYTLVKIHSKGA